MKRKINYLITSVMLLFIMISHVDAEQKSIVIEGSSDDYANSTIIAEDGSFVVVGEFSSNDIEGLSLNGSYDAFIVKYNQYGEQQWIKNYGGSDDDSFYDVINTPDNGFIAVGYTCSTNIENLTLIGNCDGIAVKYDKDGNIEWQQNYGTQYDDKINVISKAQDGTYLIAGAANYYIYQYEIYCDGYVININDKGETKFERKIATKDITLILEKNNGGYYIGEYAQHSRFRAFDEDLAELWNVLPRNGTYTYVNDAVLLEDDSIVIVGTRIEADTRIAYISKYDSDGNEIWTADYGSVHEAFNNIKIDEDGNYVITGGKKVDKDSEQVSTALFIKYDTDGNIISEETYQTDKASWFYGMDYVSKNGYVYVGSTFISGASNQDDILIVYDMQDFIYNIKTTVDGKGTVEVIPNSKAGEKVTFTVTPEEGYVLSEVKVTDANGNTITFTDNTFTMPNADVTIEVTFAKEETNPETSDLIIISCIAIIVSGAILTYLNIKKRISMI